MLSEGYLCGIPYHDLLKYKLCGNQEEETVQEMRSLNGVTYACTEEMQGRNGRNLFWRCRSVGKLILSVCSKENRNSRRQSDMAQATQNTEFEREISPAVEISIGSAVSRETYLVPSSCKSICKNYNDLHIAGGQVMPMSSVKTDFTCDSGIGPFLESSEIPSPMESISMPPAETPRKPAQGYSSCWQVTSIMQHQQPLSNSVLNDYLEEKVVELYKQYIIDGMGNSASPTQILASEFIMTNVDQISMKLSQERNMKTTKAKDMIINCLLQLASGKMSTEISTPSLHISK